MSVVVSKYFRCFDAKGNPNGLKFGFDIEKRLKDNPKAELCILQSCFGQLDPVMYLLNNGFTFVGNYVGCERCTFNDTHPGGAGKIWRNGNIYIGACRECGFIYIMKKLN